VGRSTPRFESSVVLAALAGIALLTLLFFAAWRFGSDTPDTLPDFSTEPPAAAPTPPAAPKQRAPARRARMTITGALGDSWVEVYANSPSGRQLYEGTVQAGRSVVFGRDRVYRRYFVRARTPESLRLTVNGRERELPARGAFYVTARRVTAAAAA
jgi:hypothetical protein